MQTDIKTEIQKTMNELEQVADEVRVKIHLGELDARDMWAQKLEPLLFQARVHAKEASGASKHAIEAALKAIRAFGTAFSDRRQDPRHTPSRASE
jgi:hypothetical protein